MPTHSTRVLSKQPDLDQLRRQAKELLAGFLAGSPEAVREVNRHYRAADAATFALHDAQLVLARAYGFESWPKLKACVDGVTTSRLCEAASCGDISDVRHLLQRRPEIVNFEWPHHGEQKAIHVAVLRRDPAMVRLLMQNGADARCGIWPHRDATAALTFAEERGYDDITAIIHEEEQRRQSAAAPPEGLDWIGNEDGALAALRADPDAIHRCDPDGWTCLHAAAGMLQPRAVAWLLAEGADVHRRAQREWTPLDFAASGNAWPKGASPDQFPPVARLLLAAGAQPSAISEVALGDISAVRSRHARGELSTATSHDVFAPYGGLLSIAVMHNRAEMLRLLLDLGLDPDERTRVPDTEEWIESWGMPLYRCAGSHRMEMAELLLARGADANAEIFTCGTPVGRAYGAHDSIMVDLLVRHGGVVYAANAGYYRDTALARRLFAEEDAGHLRAGAVRRGSTLAETLLDSGASGGDPEIVRMALARIDWPRDDPHWRQYLRTPLTFWNHIVRIPTADPSLDRATYLACFRLILDRCDANLRFERSGQSILHEVAAMGSHVTEEEVVEFATVLLDAGARLDLRDNFLLSTPLGWACRWGRIEMVRLLIARGADSIEGGAEPWATPRAWAKKMGHNAILGILPAIG